MTKIEERALAIHQSEGTHKQALLLEWRNRYKFDYPQYGVYGTGQPLVCDLVKRGFVRNPQPHLDAILQPAPLRYEPDGDVLWA